MLEIGLEKTVAVVADKASNIRQAWDIIEETYPRIFVNGCAAHVIDSLLQDVLSLEMYKNASEFCVRLMNLVKSRETLLSSFRDEQIYCKRWEMARYSSINCMKSVLQNKPVIEMLIMDPVFMVRLARSL